jgi:hypothetical protein
VDLDFKFILQLKTLRLMGREFFLKEKFLQEKYDDLIFEEQKN